jgi:hypothetical protein
LVFNSSRWHRVTIFQIFLFVLWSSYSDTKLSTYSECIALYRAGVIIGTCV